MKLSIHNAKKEIKRIHNLALVAGDGRSFPADLLNFKTTGIPFDLACCGRSYQHPLTEGKMLHWLDVDCGTSIAWAKSLPNRANIYTHTMGDYDAFDIDWDVVDTPWARNSDALWHGSSALFAAMACIAMGYDRVILAGCPMDTNGHWYLEEQYKGPVWNGDSYRAWLDFAETEDGKKVTSMSGYTKKILGGPKW